MDVLVAVPLPVELLPLTDDLEEELRDTDEFLLVLLLVPMPFLTVVVLLLLVTVCPEDLLMPLPSVCARSP